MKYLQNISYPTGFKRLPLHHTAAHDAQIQAKKKRNTRMKYTSLVCILLHVPEICCSNHKTSERNLLSARISDTSGPQVREHTKSILFSTSIEYAGTNTFPHEENFNHPQN